MASLADLKRVWLIKMLGLSPGGSEANLETAMYNSNLVPVLYDSSTNAVPTASALAIGEINGTGSPEGVVTAPVGTVYTDKNATNGAIDWIKAAGVSNTGWQVSYGDTGWRTISSLIDPAVVTTITSPWRMRRVNNRVSFVTPDSVIAVATASGLNAYTLPLGFRPNTGGYLSFTAPSNNQEALTYQCRINPAFDGVPWAVTFYNVSRIALTGSGRINFTMYWDTDDAWPTGALPGS